MADGETSVPAGFEFWSAQLERLGKRDPMEVLAESPDALERLLGGLAADDLAAPPAPEKWSPLEILGHLVDTEWIFGFRTRTTLADPDPGFGASIKITGLRRNGTRTGIPGACWPIFGRFEPSTLRGGNGSPRRTC